MLRLLASSSPRCRYQELQGCGHGETNLARFFKRTRLKLGIRKIKTVCSRKRALSISWQFPVVAVMELLAQDYTTVHPTTLSLAPYRVMLAVPLYPRGFGFIFRLGYIVRVASNITLLLMPALLSYCQRGTSWLQLNNKNKAMNLFNSLIPPSSTGLFWRSRRAQGRPLAEGKGAPNVKSSVLSSGVALGECAKV